MIRLLFGTFVLWLAQALSVSAADEALTKAMELAKKTGGIIRQDSSSGAYEHLWFDDARMTDDDVIAIVDLLKKAKPESKVNIRQVFLGPMHGDKAVKKVAELPEVGFLCIRRSKVTDAGLVALKSMKNLTTLRANDTAISDVGLKHLGELPKLNQLFLANTAITDAGLKHLQKLRLVSLDVKGTKVTEAGANSIKGVKVDR